MEFSHPTPATPVNNNWYVITGGPSSGKTTTVNILKSRGYKTTIEDARHYIDLQRITGRKIEDIRRNQEVFQRTIVDMQVQQENQLNPDDLIFLDRALPDSLAYFRFTGLEPNAKLLDSLKTATYKKVFIMDVLPLDHDYARTEGVIDQIKIDALIREVYGSLPWPIVRVPVLAPDARADFILANL
jgi:predicted ATPase